MLTRREFLSTAATAASSALLWKAARASAEAISPPTLEERAGLIRPDETCQRFYRTTPLTGRVTGAEAVVNLVTAESLAESVLTRVRWAESATALPSSTHVSPALAASKPLTRLELPIAGLEPNREYVYRVEFTSAQSPGKWFMTNHTSTFRSQKTAGRAFRFAVIADPHWGHPRRVVPGSPRWWSAQQCFQRIIADGPFDFLIDLGDSPMPVETESAADAVDRYLHYRDIMAPLARAMPPYLVLGNHEKEAGFHQRGADARDPPRPFNQQTATQYHQKWSTAARLLCIPNPRGDTYPEGGEGATGYDSRTDWLGQEGPWNEGTARSHLQNFYAWTWGDALFVVLDPFRYTRVGSIHPPTSPTHWTLGPTQLQWLTDLLTRSNAAWKFIFCHHLVGGGLINRKGERIPDGGREANYGRGSAIEADRPGSEQARIHKLMRQHGVRFFVYGHDHAFCHSVKDEVHYLCCGRPTWVSQWWSQPGMLESYGSIIEGGRGRPWVRALYNVLGYAQFEVSSEAVRMRWIRTGYSFPSDVVPIEQAERDWRESWAGKRYRVDSPSSVTVPLTPTDVDGVRTVAGARIPGFFQSPLGKSYYGEPSPVRPEKHSSGTISLNEFPEPIAVVDTVPELMYEVTFAS